MRAARCCRPEGVWNTGVSGKQPTLPNPPAIGAAPVQGQAGFLVAWDPVAQQERWRVTFGGGFNQGGTVTTAGNLVFHGAAAGRLVASSADKGEKLWEMPLGGGSVTEAVAGPTGDHRTSGFHFKLKLL